MTTRKIASVLIVLFGLAAGVPAADSPAPAGGNAVQFTIYYGPTQNAVQVKKEAEGKWTATESGQARSVTVDANYHVTLLEGGKTVAEGRLKEGKLALATPEKKFYLEVKFKEEKIKIAVTEGAPVTWDLKTKADEQSGELKIKLKYGETEKGKVKYDPAKRKLKVKDAGDQEVAVSREIGRLSAAPAVFLISDLSPEQRSFLLLLLIALNK